MTADKVRTLAECADMVPDGATLGIGGLSMNSAPMAFVRELVRRGTRDLTLVAIVAGMPVDWLVAAGCVRKVVSGLVSFEGFGLAPQFRAAVQRGEVEMEEYSEHTLICRLQAAAYRLPFIPTKAGLGTDMINTHPDTTRLETDASTGTCYVACTPLHLDFAVVHAHAADREGNARVDPKLLWMDSELVKAADRTVVTVERIAHHQELIAAPHATTYPRFVVDAVALAPWGAYPTSMFPSYSHDAAFFEAYVAAARQADEWTRWWHQRVVDPDDQGAFLEANGGSRTLMGIARRPA